MKAQKMFEILGFTKVRDNDFIVYLNTIPECEPICVTFIKKYEQYIVQNTMGHLPYVDNTIHMAITQQIEELGWL